MNERVIQFQIYTQNVVHHNIKDFMAVVEFREIIVWPVGRGPLVIIPDVSAGAASVIFSGPSILLLR